ncbi:YkyA family protein [Piscibacillus salipiscarius]|uniref:YkyA family protein n=1 Tax=Piscibacillus salipiscarius TaxID=299480 RepID=A0ABW5QCV9_9BACI|nr:YkyA family protein [Piscibacillus salipiscarius]
MKRVMTSALILLIMFFLAACSEDYNPAEDMYTHLEKSVELESSFQSAQSELVKLEEKENELYNKMMEINMNELDEIKPIIKEALGLVEERRKLMEQEKESIDAAKEEFDQVQEYIEELDEEPKEIAINMVDKMNERYEGFNELYNAYNSSLDLDAELYEMLKNEELKKKDLDAQVEKVNNSYNEVQKAQEKFNKLTQEFNDLKKQFYEASGLNVEYEN